MDNVTRLLMQSSGGKKDITYVDDVFSTDLRIGTNSNTAINNGIKLGNSNAGNSVLFDNVNDYLEIAHTTDLCVGSGDFTIECWAYYRGNFESYDGLFGNWTGSGDDGYILETVGSGATTDLEFYYYNDSNTFVGPVQGGSVSKDQWNHLCVCRSGNTIRLFVNGTMHGSGTSITTGIRDGTSNFTVGGQVAAGGWWNGYITNLRVTKGQALYTSNFTPSTSELTTTSQGATGSNVKLLCCNKETVTDSTVTPGTIISKGDAGGPPTPVPFGPFTGTGGEGGMVWYKPRNATQDHKCIDTVRGVQKYIQPNEHTSEITASDMLSAFNTNGFIWGDSVGTNELVWWTFRKAKGFFDIVTWSGNGTGGRQIAHGLGSVPGCIMIKNTNDTQNWQVYHRGIGAGSALFLDLNYAKQTGAQFFNNVEPTSTHFTLGTDAMNNGSGKDYVAYVFAGGGSTAATARSVDFDGTGDELQVPNSTDFDFGNGDFTIEYWLKTGYTPASTNVGKANTAGNDRSWLVYFDQQKVKFYWTEGSSSNTSWSGPISTTSTLQDDHWHHVAVTRTGGYFRLFVDGVEEANHNIGTTSIPTSTVGAVIGGWEGTNLFTGTISNVRIVKGTAVYTSSFRPPTEPLTNITNTKLLCCNNSSTTGSTVTPGTITANGDPTASTDSPFYDPAGFKFGESGKENIIKCGGYTGGTAGQEINVGFEPQWLLIKSASNSQSWQLVDSMRGFTAKGLNDEFLSPNSNDAEADDNRVFPTSTGFGLDTTDYAYNGSGSNYIYIAIRRIDGYVSRPVEDATKVFAMDTGNSSSTIPCFDSGFPVDFAMFREIAATCDWFTGGRLVGTKYLLTNTTAAEANLNSQVWDSNTGFQKGQPSGYQAFMWRRSAGFDVVAYTGNAVDNRNIPHSLGRVAEMVWVKNRESTNGWQVFNKYLNGGTNPHTYRLELNETSAESSAGGNWGNGSPTSTHFIVGDGNGTNGDDTDYLAMLFASVDGISKVGSYSGTGSSHTITTGFQPRVIIFKKYSGGGNWYLFDSLRGITSGDPAIYIDTDQPASGFADKVTVSSTAWTLTSDTFNGSGQDWIYYAHA